MTKNWKADEMEMSINFKAMRGGWVFLIIALAVWCLISAIVKGEFPTIPFLLECISGLIFWVTKFLLTKQMTEGEVGDDEE